MSTSTPSPAQIGDRVFDGVFEYSLDFRVEMDYEAARQFVRRIESYNAFEGDAVLADFKIAVGREGSPVIYLERIEWSHSRHLDDTQLRLICREMQVIASADEADFDAEPFPYAGGRKITFRFWWD